MEKADFFNLSAIAGIDQGDLGIQGNVYLSVEARKTVVFVLFAVTATTISIVGVVANVVNVAVFVKQGFKETVDISLTALAISDMASLLCLLWMGLCYNQAFRNAVDHVNLVFIEYLTASLPRAYFTVISGCITSVIAFTRCLSVLRPLDVRVLFTRKRLLVTFVCMFSIVLTPYLPFFYTTSFVWLHNPETNATVLTLTLREDRHQIEYICFSIMVALCVATYVVVSSCTAIIVWKLASQSAWRARKSASVAKEATSQANPDDKKEVSGKDRRATKTVILIATLYIVCFLPGAVIQLAMAFIPNFNKGMLYDDLFELSWALAYNVEAICSSANILIYWQTSTKFKETLVSLFMGSRRKSP